MLPITELTWIAGAALAGVGLYILLPGARLHKQELLLQKRGTIPIPLGKGRTAFAVPLKLSWWARRKSQQQCPITEIMPFLDRSQLEEMHVVQSLPRHASSSSGGWPPRLIIRWEDKERPVHMVAFQLDEKFNRNNAVAHATHAVANATAALKSIRADGTDGQPIIRYQDTLVQILDFKPGQQMPRNA